MDRIALVDKVNALLPQTQCTRCGYEGCKPYATAIAEGAAINKCPPGGAATIRALSLLLAKPVLPLDPVHGVEGPRTIAVIREAECIGCTKCIQACPVDAILGSAKQMHTVIESECTGCDLCVAPCPVDCIDMVPLPALALAPALSEDRAWQELRERATHCKDRYDFNQARKAADAASGEQRRMERAALAKQKQTAADTADAKATIAAALERVKAKKALQQPSPAPKADKEQNQQ